MRTGADYVAALKDDREVYLDGQRVPHVAEHPAFAGVVQTVAGLYDFGADPANGMTYVAPETGREANRVFMIPRDRADLATRRLAVRAWADLTNGFVGRSPDHVGAFLAGFAADPAAFARPGRDFGAHVSAYYRRLLDESLYLSYAIVPPQHSRATTAHGWECRGSGSSSTGTSRASGPSSSTPAPTCSATRRPRSAWSAS